MDQHLANVTFTGFKTQSALGTPAVGPYANFGTGNARIERNSNNIYWRPAGQRTRGGAKGGGLVHNWSYNFDTIHTPDALMLGQITAGNLPYVTIVGGYDDVVDANWSMQDCMVGALTLSCNVGNEVAPLTGSISGIGGYVTKNVTASVVSPLVRDPLASYDVIFTLGGSGMELTAFDLSLAYQQDPRFVIKGAARVATKVRLWDYLKVGTIDVTGSLTLMEPLPTSGLQSPGLDLDCLAPLAAVFRVVDTCFPANILNIAIAGIYIDTESAEFSSSDEATFTYPFTALSATMTVV